MSNRVLYKDLVVGESYFFLQVGFIRKLKLIDFDDEKALAKNDFGQTDYFLGDIGVYDAPLARYKNELNMLFVNYDDANDMKKSSEYKAALQDHQQRMSDLWA